MTARSQRDKSPLFNEDDQYYTIGPHEEVRESDLYDDDGIYYVEKENDYYDENDVAEINQSQAPSVPQPTTGMVNQNSIKCFVFARVGNSFKV